ncbi:MAG: PEP-CTERM sorting domain-containing protein [Methylobacter sp.]|nr:PEP-CTERM sorting domain-containing protein [Methylobacter sp.]
MIGFKQTATVALLATGLVFGSTAQAALIDRGSGLIYDDILNITWLQDANYSKTSGYSGTGLMDWFTAKTWAANLVYHDSVRNVDYSDWRLPTTNSGFGYGYMAESELGVLYRFLGGQQVGSNVSQYNTLFSNVQNYSYWSGTDFAGSYLAFYYDFSGNPGGSLSWKGDPFYAWAVRPGDVAAVPLPSTIWLFASGLGLLSFTRRKQNS